MMNPVTTTYYNSQTLDRVAAIPVVGTFAGVGRVSMGFLKVAFNTGVSSPLSKDGMDGR